MAKAKNFVTPKGELEWVFIDGEGRLDLNGKPRFSVSLKLKNDSKELAKIEAEIQEYWKENKPPKINKMKSNGIRSVLKDGEPTGYTYVNFWTGTTFQDGSPKVVDVYNAAGTKVNLGGKKIGNGSEGFVSGAMAIYEQGPQAGITLYLNAVQLTKFEEYLGNVVLAEEKGGWTGEDLNPEGFQPQPGKPNIALEDDLPF